MNVKMMTLAAVVVMVLAGTTVLYADQSDAVGGSESEAVDLGKIYLYTTDADGQSVVMKFNESAYTGYGEGQPEVKLSAQISITEPTGSLEWSDDDVVDIDDGLTVSNLKLTYAGGTVNERTITVTSNDATPGTQYIILRLDMSVTPSGGSEINPNPTINLNPIYYKIEVVVRDQGSLIFDYTDGNTEYSVQVGEKADVILNVQIQEGTDVEGIKDVGDYSWYAENLPSGLNLVVSGNDGASTLMITGMSNSTTGSVTVHVMARNNATGSEYSGNFNIKVTEAKKITYALSGSEVQVVNNTHYVMQNSTEPTLTIEGADASDVDVTVIKMGTEYLSREPVEMDGTSGSCTGTVPITGVGTYIIEISGPGGVTEVTLTVIPAATGAGVGLIVIGS